MEQRQAPAARGWTRERRVRFLKCLAGEIDVRRACAGVGLSRQSAYALRRRDPGFASLWAAALREAGARKFHRLIARRLARIEAARLAAEWDGGDGTDGPWPDEEPAFAVDTSGNGRSHPCLPGRTN